MPTFRYQSLSSNGTPSEGAVIEAPDRAGAVRTLMQRGIMPTTLDEVPALDLAAPPAAAAADGSALPGDVRGGPGAVPARGGAFSLTSVMSRSDMAAFIREVATAIQAGLPLVPALRTIARQGRTARQLAMLQHLIHHVEHGMSLGDAAQSWGKPFNDLTINLIRAGEASGRMGEVLDQAANLLDRDVKLRRSILGATLYPLILTGLVTIAVVIVVTIIVPRILAPLAGTLKASDLPMPTRMVEAVAGFVSADWWLILGIIAAGAIGWSRLYTQPGPRLAIDRALIRSPILGRLLRDVAVARFTRTLGTLVSAGLPALSALRITKATLGNRAMEVVIDKVCDEVASGKTIADPMERSGYFPPLLVQIVSVGERSGRLAQMLNQAADAFEGRTESSVKLFTTALPPILVVMLACVVGFVIAAILLPLLQMQEYIGK